jgi:hypothetical protein
VGPSSFTGKGGWPETYQGEENWYDLRIDGEANIWRDDYYLIPFGLLENPVVEVRG